MISYRTPEAKADSLYATDAEARKPGEQTGFKEIDGGPHKQRSMWLNSMQREEPYLGLTCRCTGRESAPPSRVLHRCCMAVVSSCREVFG